MSKASQYIKELNFIFGNQRTKLPGIVALFFLVSLFDIAGLGLVAPFVSVVLNQENHGAGDGRIYQLFRFIFGEQDRQSHVIFLGASLAAIFLFKAIAVTFVNRVIFGFSGQQGVILRTRLMKKFQILKRI